MKYFTHNQLPININSTSYQGIIRVSYDQIVQAFGKPLTEGLDKSDAEWEIRFEDGTIATVYNWKNGPSYGGPPAEYIDEWNVGGHSQTAYELVKQTLMLDITGTSTRLPLP